MSVVTSCERCGHLLLYPDTPERCDWCHRKTGAVQGGIVSETLMDQIDRLANWIMANVPGEPSKSEGAVDCAIRIMESNRRAESKARDARELLQAAVNRDPLCASAATADAVHEAIALLVVAALLFGGPVEKEA